jgi:hypothetical protein
MYALVHTGTPAPCCCCLATTPPASAAHKAENNPRGEYVCLCVCFHRYSYVSVFVGLLSLLLWLKSNKEVSMCVRVYVYIHRCSYFSVSVGQPRQLVRLLLIREGACVFVRELL